MANEQISNLSLYHYQACPYCGITREAINYIDLDIDQRDILKQAKYRAELIKGGGKPQVPCLKIETKNGTTQWLYESRDIISYLQKHAVELKQSA